MSSGRNEVLAFSGKDEDWVFWRGKFLAHGRRLKFAKLLKGQAKAPPATQSLINPHEQALLDAHDDGYTEIVIAMLDRKISTDIAGCVSVEHPDGDLLMAWNYLNDKFQPKNSSDKILLTEDLFGCKLGPMETPEEWIGRFEVIQRKLETIYGVTYDDEDVLTMLMKGLSGKYKDLRISFLKQLDSKVEKLTVESFKTQVKLHAKYCEDEVENVNNMENMALMTTNNMMNARNNDIRQRT